MRDIGELCGSPEWYVPGVSMLLSKLKNSVRFEFKFVTHSVA